MSLTTETGEVNPVDAIRAFAMTLGAAVLASLITGMIMEAQRHAYRKGKEAIQTIKEKRQKKSLRDS